MSKAVLAFLAFLLVACAASPASGQQGGAAAPAAEQAKEMEEADRLSNTVVRLYSEGKLDEALPLARRALELRERAAGPDHALVSVALNNLAAIHVAKKQYGEAETLYKRSLGIGEKNPGPNRHQLSETLIQFGWLRYARGEYSRAEDLLARAVREKEEALGQEHAGVLRPLFQLARFRAARNENEEAGRLYERAVALLEKQQPPRKDAASARELRRYLCLLESRKRGKNTKTLFNLVRRLEDPEKAAKLERLEKEAEAQGGDSPDGEVVTGRVLSRPAPHYPEDALRAGVSGAVLVEIVVDEAGRVAKTEVVCGHPLLTKASEEAVRKWRFTPTMLDGKPVAVTGLVSVNFRLQR